MFRTFLVFLLVIGCASVAFADSAEPSRQKGYQPEAVYSGLYNVERLYQYNPYDDAWYASKALRSAAGLSCSAARWTLMKKGEWIGVLTDAGACSGTVEGQRWVTGNYLNFLINKSAAARARDNESAEQQ